MVDFPNPDGFDVLAAQTEGDDTVGDIWDAARTAGVEPGTIRVWMTRGKIEPLVRHADSAPDLFHLPTIAAASQRRAGRPRAA